MLTFVWGSECMFNLYQAHLAWPGEVTNHRPLYLI